MPVSDTEGGLWGRRVDAGTLGGAEGRVVVLGGGQGRGGGGVYWGRLGGPYCAGGVGGEPGTGGGLAGDALDEDVVGGGGCVLCDGVLALLVRIGLAFSAVGDGGERVAEVAHGEEREERGGYIESDKKLNRGLFISVDGQHAVGMGRLSSSQRVPLTAH